MITETGAVVSEMLYKPWGEVRYTSGTMPTDRTYTGQISEPDLGLSFYSARWYDSSLGRFLSPDSNVPEKGNPLGLNRYAYVANNSMNYVDPSGHCWGFASGMRGWSFLNYKSTCQNIDMALTIIQTEDTSLIEKVGAGAYVAFEGAAHAAVVIGSVACLSNPAVCVAGAKTALGIGGAACADGDCGNEATAVGRALGQLTNIGKNLWRSTAGLEYGPDGKYGNAVRHVLQHTVNDLTQKTFGVFTVGRNNVLSIINQAWRAIQSGGNNVISVVQQGGRTVYVVDMGTTIGYVGGKTGAINGNPATTLLKIVIENGNKIITAYPVIK